MRRRGTAALALGLAVLAAGCSGEDNHPRVATAATGSAAPSATATAPADDVAEYLAAMRTWVGCLRDHGLDASDPDPTGIVTFPDGNESKADPAVLAAQNACKAMQPPVPEAVIALRRPVLTPEQVEVRRAYADCMQRSGAPDFPDPGPDGYAGRTAGATEWDSTTAAARRASRTCAPIIGDPEVPGETVG